jgi:Zn-dependent M16 (insulinase) family peptidase
MTTRTSGFEILRSEDAPLLHTKVYGFEHRTGAKLLHFACDDDDLRFAAIIPTVPTDETGAPHILEHCLFSGSKHYPDAASRSGALITGGGAWTGWEYTWYFFSAPRAADFLARIDIWCDSLFEPLLEPETFEYQAHHYEFDEPDDPSTPLRIRGVIYNEQKGILGHPIAVGWAAVCRALFPGHPYALEHGGTPRGVPSISYEQLKAFHERHYHPANARFLTWGDVDVDDLLETFDAALTRVPVRPFTATPYPPVIPLSAPVRHTDRLPIGANDDPSGRSIVLMAWVTAPCTDPYETLLHDLLAELLMAAPDAPLRAALATSGLGRAVAETYDRYGIRFVRHTIAAGLQDTDPSNADEIEAVIMRTLERLASDGFDDDAIDAVLNKLEFRLRTLAGPQGDEGSPTSFWIQHINTPWVAGADPFERLTLEPYLERLARERQNGRPVEERLRSWFIDNPHRALVVIEADPGADIRLEREVTEELARVKAAMSDDQKLAIVARTKHLREHLETRSAPPAAPAPEVVGRTEIVPINTEAAGVPVEAYPVRTSGITYLDLFVDIGSLSDELWDYVHLFSLVLVRSGGADLQRRIGVFTGGVTSEVEVPVCGDGETHRRLLRIGGRALERNVPAFVDALARLPSVDFEATTVRSVLDAALAHAEQQVFIDAPGYLRRLAGSYVRNSWALRDRLDGFTQLALLRRLGRASEAELDDLLGKLTSIRDTVMVRGSLGVFIAASSDDAIGAATAEVGDAVSSFPGGGSQGRSWPDLRRKTIAHEARTFGQPTAFNCEVFTTPGRSHPDAPAILIAGALAAMSVRADVQRAGTAYNATADGYSDPGSLVCWSIRDPNITRTYGSFERSLADLRAGKIETDMVANAKLEASVGANLPSPPPERARRSFVDRMVGFGPDEQRRFFDAIPAVTAQDVQRAVSDHVAMAGPRASLTSAEMAAEAGIFDVVREA